MIYNHSFVKKDRENVVVVVVYTDVIVVIILLNHYYGLYQVYQYYLKIYVYYFINSDDFDERLFFWTITGYVLVASIVADIIVKDHPFYNLMNFILEIIQAYICIILT